LIKKISFPDHYHFSENEIKTIVDNAIKGGCEIYTTAKDWVRINHNYKDKIKEFPINLEIKEKEKFIKAIFN
jgi:tetraacyldisaccharide-1-P 4'-kinase